MFSTVWVDDSLCCSDLLCPSGSGYRGFCCCCCMCRKFEPAHTHFQEKADGRWQCDIFYQLHMTHQCGLLRWFNFFEFKFAFHVGVLFLFFFSSLPPPPFSTYTAILHTVWNTPCCNCVTMLPQILFSTSSVPQTQIVCQSPPPPTPFSQFHKWMLLWAMSVGWWTEIMAPFTPCLHCDWDLLSPHGATELNSH